MSQSFEQRRGQKSVDEWASDVSLILDGNTNEGIRASAPGRVEFIGNHTDYNGGWVLGATIDRRVEVVLQRRSDRQIRLQSEAAVPPVEVPLGSVERQSGEWAWANYILGMVEVLQGEGMTIESGFDLRVGSTLPVGAGLSSSAALELASGAALSEAYGGEFLRRDLVRMAQRAENEFVGVPCGLLDQAVVALGGADRLVRLDARSEATAAVPFPPETGIWIFRTHQAHALSESGYQERHDEARAVRERLRELLGNEEAEYLVDVSPSQLEEVKRELSKTLYRRARHVVTEHRRTQRVVQLLKAGRRAAAGRLLFASHESSRVDYENSTEALDFVVDRLAEQEGVLGARLTGAGFGGAAMAWTRAGYGEEQAHEVAGAYADRFGTELETLACRPAPGLYVWA